MNKYKGLIRLRYWLYDFIKLTGIIPALMYFRFKKIYIDKNNYKKYKKSLLIVSNHTSFKDPIIGNFMFNFKRIFMIGMQDLFNKPFKSWFFSSCNVIKVNKNHPELSTIDESIQVLRAKKSLFVFPEGKLNKEDKMIQFKKGISLIAYKSNSSILPIYIKKRKSFFNRQQIYIGKVIDINAISIDKKPINAINDLNNIIYEEMQKLENIANINNRKD